MLSEEAKAARREYDREYRRKNPEKFRRYKEAYWEKKAALASNSNSGAEESRENE